MIAFTSAEDNSIQLSSATSSGIGPNINPSNGYMGSLDRNRPFLMVSLVSCIIITESSRNTDNNLCPLTAQESIVDDSSNSTIPISSPLNAIRRLSVHTIGTTGILEVAFKKGSSCVEASNNVNILLP